MEIRKKFEAVFLRIRAGSALYSITLLTMIVLFEDSYNFLEYIGTKGDVWTFITMFLGIGTAILIINKYVFPKLLPSIFSFPALLLILVSLYFIFIKLWAIQDELGDFNIMIGLLLLLFFFIFLYISALTSVILLGVISEKGRMLIFHTIWFIVLLFLLYQVIDRIGYYIVIIIVVIYILFVMLPDFIIPEKGKY